MDPNYFESFVKHLTPKFIIDDRIEIEKELVEQFINNFKSLFQNMNNKLKEIKPEDFTNKKGKVHHEFGVNSFTNKHSQLSISLAFAKDFFNPLAFYEMPKREIGVSFFIEVTLKNNECAKDFFENIKSKVEPRYDEFPYYQCIKAYNGNFYTYYKENKICLEIFLPLDFYDEFANVIDLILMDKFNFGILIKLKLIESINLRKLQDLSKEEFYRHLVNRNIDFDINIENYWEIFKAFLDCVNDIENPSEFACFLEKIILYFMIVKDFDSGFKFNISNEKFVDFLVQLGVDKTPIDYWTNVIYEEALDLKQLFLDIYNNFEEHLHINQNLENVTGISVTRTLNKSKISFTIHGFEL